MTTSKQRFAAIAFTFEAGLGIVAILVGRGLGFDPLLTLGLDKPTGDLVVAGLWGALAALPLLIGLVVVDRLPGVLAEFKETIGAAVLPLFAGLSWLEVAVISLAAGCGEELLFRGLIQAGLQAWLDQPAGWLPAVLVASLAFGVCHWLNATYALLAAAVGVYLGGLYLLADDLLAPITAHALYDFVAILYLTRRSSRLTGPTNTDGISADD